MKKASKAFFACMVLFQNLFGQKDSTIKEKQSLLFDFTSVEVGKVRQGNNLEIWFPFTVHGPNGTKIETNLNRYNPDFSRMNNRSFKRGERDSIHFAINTMNPGTFNKYLIVKAKGDGTSTKLHVGGEIIPKGRPWIDWKTTLIDFDSIEQNTRQEHYFWFYNRGDSSLHIIDGKRSCQCFEATIPKEPILPGDSSYIKVSYSGAYPDRFEKYITVVSTAANSPSTLIYKGVVTTKKD